MLSSRAMKVFARFAALSLTALSLGFVSDGNAAASEASALSTVKGDGYQIVVTDGSGQVGQETQVIVTIKAAEGYKVNEKYPHKLKLGDAPAGLEFPKPVLKKDDGTFDGKKSFTFKVPVKATRAGTFSLEGKLKFSVCNDSQCLVEKKELKAKVTAK